MLNHRSGRIDQAEALYRQVLAQTPENPYALHSLGLIEYQKGRPIQAAALVRRAIDLMPGVPHFHNTLGVALEALGHPDQAVACYRQAVTLKCDYAEAYNNMAIALNAQGDPEGAIQSCRLLLDRVPGYAKAYHTMGYCHQTLGRFDQAMECYQRALEFDPDLIEAANLLGVVLACQGRHAEALAYYRLAIERAPEYAEAQNNLGIALLALGRGDEAIVHFQTAIAKAPNFPEAFYNLAHAQAEKGLDDLAVQNCHHALRLKPDYAQPYNQLGMILASRGDLDQAMESYQRAIERDPAASEYYNNLAIVLKGRGDFGPAMAYYQRAIELEPGFTQAFYNLANLNKELGDCPKAIECYDRAIALQPDYADAHWNLALALLLHGQMAQGWKEYQWRHRAQLDTALYPHRFDKPRWDSPDPSRVAGKRLLVYCEQGLGDAVQFVRYVPRLRCLCAQVLLETWPSLTRLFAGLPGVDRLIEASTRKVSEDEFDLCVSIMDLPYLMGTTIETIPNAIPYLLPDRNKTWSWKQRLAGPELKVGVVWAGRPTHGNDHNRSCPLDYLVPLTDLPGIRVFSLQKGPAADRVRQLHPDVRITPLADEFQDLMDAACCVAALDLVISVDTAMAHLAGALAKPVWTLLPFAPDWRWMLNRPDSPWYPTMRLFRQSRPGDWGSVFRDVTLALETSLKNH